MVLELPGYTRIEEGVFQESNILSNIILTYRRKRLTVNTLADYIAKSMVELVPLRVGYDPNITSKKQNLLKKTLTAELSDFKKALFEIDSTSILDPQSKPSAFLKLLILSVIPEDELEPPGPSDYLHLKRGRIDNSTLDNLQGKGKFLDYSLKIPARATLFTANFNLGKELDALNYFSRDFRELNSLEARIFYTPLLRALCQEFNLGGEGIKDLTLESFEKYGLEPIAFLLETKEAYLKNPSTDFDKYLNSLLPKTKEKLN